MIGPLCFQWQNLGSKGAWEVETLHVLNQLFPESVCHNSSKFNIFQGEKTGDAKNGQTKKHKFHEMLDLRWFQSQNLESRGTQEVETLHVV